MKLNPPGSSSDLETAREIARRLHQRRRRADFEQGERRSSPADAPARETPASWVSRPENPSASAPPPDIRPPAADDEPAPPTWDDEADEPGPGGSEDHLSGALDGLTDEAGPAEPPEAPFEGDEEGSEPVAAALPSFEDGDESLPPPEPDFGIDVEDGVVSPDEMVGTAGADSVEVEFDEPLGGEALDAPPEAEASASADAGIGLEDPFDESASPPSWDDVVETCRGIAGASGAMIIDPAGQIFAARGDWPEPGPDAIAARLVAMMERTLKDAPTRSVSAPVGGQHLTAWRVALAEGLVTTAFIADSPLRAESRSAIDAEIRRGAGA